MGGREERRDGDIQYIHVREKGRETDKEGRKDGRHAERKCTSDRQEATAITQTPRRSTPAENQRTAVDQKKKSSTIHQQTEPPAVNLGAIDHKL